jgi:hypothetical protein
MVKPRNWRCSVGRGFRSRALLVASRARSAESPSIHPKPSVVSQSAQAIMPRPIYASSVGRWRKYRHHLMPLILRLHDGGRRAAAGRFIGSVADGSQSIDLGEFRCSGIPLRQGMLRLEPHSEFIIGAERSDEFGVRLGFRVRKRRSRVLR